MVVGILGCGGRLGCGGQLSWSGRLSLFTRCTHTSRPAFFFLEGQAASSRVTVSNNRSVMPLDVLGRTRATLKESACYSSLSEKTGQPLNLLRGWDWGLQ